MRVRGRVYGVSVINFLWTWFKFIFLILWVRVWIRLTKFKACYIQIPQFWVILCLFEVKPDTMRLRCRAQLLLLSACQLQLLFIRIANRFGILAYMLFSSQNYSLNYLGKRPHSADSFDSSDPALYNTNFRSHFANIRNWFLDFFFNAEHVIPDLKWDFWNSYIHHLIQFFFYIDLSLGFVSLLIPHFFMLFISHFLVL